MFSGHDVIVSEHIRVYLKEIVLNWRFVLRGRIFGNKTMFSLMDLSPCSMWVWLIFFLGVLGWSGTAGDGILTDRAGCAFPEPCYNWVKLQDCNMGLTPQMSPSVIIAECTTIPNNPWARAYRYYEYQFDLIQEDGDFAAEPGGVIAISRCTRKAGGIVDRRDAVAVIRGPAFNPGVCLPIRVSFWFRLSHQPTFSAEPEQEYHLKVFVENRGQLFPAEMIWGNESDYADVVSHQWHYAEALFGRDVGEQFHANFFAYHNDDCQTNLKTIAVDNIVVERAQPSPVCMTPISSTTTGPTVTTTESTTPESTTTITTTYSTPWTDSTTSKTTTISTISSSDYATSKTTTITATTSTLSPDTSDTSTTNSTTLTDTILLQSIIILCLFFRWMYC